MNKTQESNEEYVKRSGYSIDNELSSIIDEECQSNPIKSPCINVKGRLSENNALSLCAYFDGIIKASKDLLKRL